MLVNPHDLPETIYYEGTISRIREALDAPEAVNFLLYAYSDMDTVFDDDPSTYENEERTLAQCADIHFTTFDVSYYMDSDRVSQLEDYLSPDPAYIQSAIYGRSVFCDQRGDRKDNGSFVFHSFHAYPPEALVERIFSYVTLEYTPFHWPYRANDHDAALNTYGLVTLPFDQPFHIMVIDELDPNSVDATGLPSAEYSAATALGVVKRRVVEMNPAGLVLLDTTWDFTTDAEGVIVSRFGAAEQREYDCYGRVIERRTKGWNSPENQGQEDSQGLIYVYEYEDNGCDCEQTCNPGELKAVGIKQGTAGQTYYVESYTRHPDRPDLITTEVKYPTPVDDPTSASGVTTWTSYTLDDSEPGKPVREWPIAAKTITRPAARVTAEDATEYFAGQKWTYDGEGNLIWEGAGLFADLDGENRPVDPIEFTFSHYGYNDCGQATLEILDVDVTELDPGEQPPSDYVRISSSVVPLHLVTTNEYHYLYGLSRTVHPNLRETHIVYSPLSGKPASLDVWTYRDVIPPGEGPCVLTSPVLLSEIRGGRLEKKWQIHVESTTYPPPGNESFDPDDPDQVLSVQDATYDVNGHLVGFEAAGGPGEASIGAQLAYGAGGLLLREEGPDGTITRNVYDKFGRLSRVYRGTSDVHPFWGSAPPWDPDDPDFPYPDGYPDNLVLIEKRYYGDGVTDMDRLTYVRHYREKPDNQYFEEAGEGDPPPWIPPNNEDGIGWATEHEYDWRMREVWVQRRAEDIPPENPEDPGVVGEPLTHALTWYDNLNRTRFVAGYGDTAPAEAGVDPRAAAPGATEPTAGEILSTSVAPLSLTESIYNKAGQVEEVRRYAIDPNSTDPDDVFTSTITFYNHRGQPLEVHAPNSPVRTYAYDAKGRQVRSSSLASGLEMTRTETQYDDNDRAIVTVHYERLDGAGGNLEDYCVRTYTHTWYDDAGKVIATANYGTNNDTFSNGDAPVYNPDPDQIPNGSGGELVTWYVYDEAGRQSEVTHPDNTKTTYEYDGLGRLLMTIENADGVGDEARRTAYEYDPNTAQLIRMAAVLQDVNSHDVIDWNSDIQITEFVYGAEVVDNDGTGISYNNGWIDEVHFPDRLTGQPDSSQLLKFTYYSNGSVASREDARGIVFEHVYDELGRRITTTVDDYAWYGAMDPNMVPPNRITQIDYDYAPDGMLALATAWADDPGDPGSSTIVAQNEFTYDGADNLLTEWQQHFGTVDGDSAVINYTWDFRSAIDASGDYDPNGNYNRPVDMTYPTRGESEVAIEFSYGDGSGDVDHALSRITEISADYDGAEYWVQYHYAGLGRRVTREYGNSGVIQSFGDGEGYPGLDRFGRVKDLHFQKPGAGQPHRARYQYGYDKAGNRTHVRTWQPALGDPNGHDNDRSYLYQYDALNRLIAADLGRLNATDDAIEESDPIPWRTDWLLDNLGNWSGGDGLTGSVIETGDFNDRFAHHDVNSANEIETLTVDAGSGSSDTTFVHDAVGNLVFDAVYWYQFDGWNRLVQVNEAGSLTDADFDADTGFLIPPDPNDPNDPDGVPGDPVARFAYDGLGRLMFCSTHLDYSEPIDGHVNRHLYYDGVRRVSEQRHTRLWGYPIVDRWDQLDYVWGPDYVDELALVIHREGGVRYAIQDANNNLVAWLKAGSVVAAQYTYGPYGELRAADLRPTETEWPSMGVGHQGLFFIRFDGDPDDPPHAVGARGLYYNRNRWYSPELGRFITRDVNATALPILAAYAFNGLTAESLLGAFEGQALYSDGMNLYLYLGGNPVNFSDALGLVYDPFEDVDDFIEGYGRDYVRITGQIATARGELLAGMMKSALYAALGFAFGDVMWEINEYILFDLVTGPFFSSICFEAGTPVCMADGSLKAIEDIRVGERVCSKPDPHAPLETRAASVAGHPADPDSHRVIDPTAWRKVELCLQDAERGLIRATLLRPQAWLEAFRATEGAEIPIHLPEMGIAGRAVVVAIEPCPEIPNPAASGEVVSGTFVTERAPLVRIHLEAVPEPIGVTPSHPFYSNDHSGWVPAGELQRGEGVRTMDGVVKVECVEPLAERTAVYNLEIHSSHTYYVGESRLWVHNPCSPDDIAKATGYRSSMGDPSDWRFLRKKPGSGAKSHDRLYRKIYEIWEDAYGKIHEVHYFLRPDGSTFDAKILY